MTPVKVQPMRPPTEIDTLQPLREVGTVEKTQFWDLDEIYQALREAKRLGIAPEQLYPQKRCA